MALSKSLKLCCAAVCLVMMAGSVVYLNQPESAWREQSTPDAYVDADLSFLGTKVFGTISKVLVEENQQVNKGDLLFEIDDTDFRVALAQSEANLHEAKAELARASAVLSQQQATIEQSIAQVDADQATLALAALDKIRFDNLLKDGAGSVQAQQTAQANEQVARSKLAQSRAQLHFNQAQTTVLQAELQRAEAALEVALAENESAKLNLSYTKITSPIDGVVGQKKVEVGQYVNIGTVLASLVPSEQLFITANYRETQLENIKPGQLVDIEVDAFPGKVLKGTVASVGPASQVSYSAIAPVNATGNFTKVVQRIPVRIALQTQGDIAKQLRVGMSVVPHITTAETSSDKGELMTLQGRM
ncbi:HlyD family secretion protein [Aestuariibacter sp. A3R04]|uniref:HlyD family secretion protein n=1 Tax=Aestuariibacter sp. A3R04 TaxID=2841571 RepID=UPI001C0A5C01|nr:HlyD family secretion protein [Aestuariibacter sp. A3R04]MBU3021315.1 HlyD family secretion protein [Aestuariibacter sp. A3R04]